MAERGRVDGEMLCEGLGLNRRVPLESFGVISVALCAKIRMCHPGYGLTACEEVFIFRVFIFDSD